MEGCLLCLEINKEFVECIKVDSSQWQELNIKHLIEKHLWIMESIQPSSWLCQICWQALYDFHQFYMRIEEAHLDFGKLMKRENEPGGLNDLKDLPIFDDDKVLFESHLEPEILMDQLMMEEDKATIKEEPNEDVYEDDDATLIPRHKRKCGSKDVVNTNETSQDPLEKSKKTKASKGTKSKSKKKEPEPQPSKEPIAESIEVDIPQVKADPEVLENHEISNLLQSSSDYDDFDLNTDVDYKPEEDDNVAKQPKKVTKKKKTKLKQNSSDSEDTNSDLDSKTKEKEIKQTKKAKKKRKTNKKKSSEAEDTEEEDTKQHHEQSHKERDQFLAENFKISCDRCQIPFETFRSLLKHFDDEHKERGYAVCCSKKFYSRGHLIEHVRYHVDPNSFKCNQCGRVLSSRKILQDHQLLHLPDEEKKFTCTECGKSFVKQSALSYHIKAFHLKKYLKMCEICGKNLRCDVFERHMLEHEGKPVPRVICQICGLRLSGKRNLKRHMFTQHPVGGKESHTCPVCLKVSPNIIALKEHIRRVHNTEETHKCAMCGRGFKKAIGLKEHMATHTGIALYTCPWCPKTFNASSSYHVHRKKQHPIEWEQTKLVNYTIPAGGAAQINTSVFSENDLN